jgi:hypothetical protein
MSGVFGGKKKTTKSESVTTASESANSTTSVGYTNPINITAGTGGGGRATVRYDADGNPTANASVDSRVRSSIAEGLNNSRSAIRRIEATIEGLRSNTSAFVKARVDPMGAALEQRIAQKEREYAARGIYGGLAASDIDQLRLQGESEISNQRAMAIQESLSSIMQAEGLAASENQNIYRVADQYLQADLAEMGLNFDAIRISQATVRENERNTTGTSSSTSTTKGKETTKKGGSILGDILSAAAAFSSPTAGAAG